jgi:acetyl-CoA carboxylase biotin carboxyl carrier protein
MASYNKIEKMSQMMDQMGLTEFKVETSFLFGIFRKEIELSKQRNLVAHPTAFAQPPVPNNSATATTEPAPAPSVVNALKSPMVGVAYLSPEPGAKAFVTVGQAVKAGDTLALIEAMKTFNPVKADRDGTVKEIYITEGQAVEFDQPLLLVE